MQQVQTQVQSEASPQTPQELEAALRAQHRRYHHLHPFHRRMNAGELTPEEVRRWV